MKGHGVSDNRIEQKESKYMSSQRVLCGHPCDGHYEMIEAAKVRIRDRKGNKPEN